MSNIGFLYHVADLEDWQLEGDYYEPFSFISDAYILCCELPQLAAWVELFNAAPQPSPDHCTTVTSGPKTRSTADRNRSLHKVNEDSEYRATPYLARAVGCAVVSSRGSSTSPRLSGGSADLKPSILLEIDPARIEVEIRWQYFAPMNALCPHIYGPLPKIAVRSAVLLQAPILIDSPDVKILD